MQRHSEFHPFAPPSNATLRDVGIYEAHATAIRHEAVIPYFTQILAVQDHPSLQDANSPASRIQIFPAPI